METVTLATLVPMFDAFGRQININQMEPHRQFLIKQAWETHAEFPQYAGMWSSWKLGLIKKDVKTKAGVAFRRGDVVLVKPEIRDISKTSYAKKRDKRSVTCYSFRTEMNTSVWLSDVAVDSLQFPTIIDS